MPLPTTATESRSGPASRALRLWRWAGWLAPAVSLLLFAQWPLREGGWGAAAVLANDAAQLLFASYICLAVAWAAREQAHVRLREGPPAPALARRAGAALLLMPWCVWLLVVGAGPAWRSLRQLERFPESFTQGYFLLRLWPVLLALLLLIWVLGELRSVWMARQRSGGAP